LPPVVDRHDGRVIQASRGLRLAPEPLHEGGVAREGVVHELERDGAIEHGVPGEIDIRHATTADQPLDYVAFTRDSLHPFPRSAATINPSPFPHPEPDSATFVPRVR